MADCPEGILIRNSLNNSLLEIYQETSQSSLSTSKKGSIEGPTILLSNTNDESLLLPVLNETSDSLRRLQDDKSLFPVFCKKSSFNGRKRNHSRLPTSMNESNRKSLNNDTSKVKLSDNNTTTKSRGSLESPLIETDKNTNKEHPFKKTKKKKGKVSFQWDNLLDSSKLDGGDSFEQPAPVKRKTNQFYNKKFLENYSLSGNLDSSDSITVDDVNGSVNIKQSNAEKNDFETPKFSEKLNFFKKSNLKRYSLTMSLDESSPECSVVNKEDSVQVSDNANNIIQNDIMVKDKDLGTANNSEKVQENNPSELNKTNPKSCDENDKLRTTPESKLSTKNEYEKINPFKKSNLIRYSLSMSLDESSPECSVVNKEDSVQVSDNANNVIQNDIMVEDKELGTANNSEKVQENNPSELNKTNPKSCDENDKLRTTPESKLSIKNEYEKINPFKKSNLIRYSLSMSLDESSPECSVVNKEDSVQVSDNVNNIIQNDIMVKDKELGTANNSEKVQENNPSELNITNPKSCDGNDKLRTTPESKLSIKNEYEKINPFKKSNLIRYSLSMSSDESSSECSVVNKEESVQVSDNVNNVIQNDVMVEDKEMGTTNNSEKVQENNPSELNKTNPKSCDGNDKLRITESMQSFKNEFKKNSKKINPFKRSNLIAYSLAQSLGESSPECSVANEGCVENNAINVIQNDKVLVQNIVTVEDEQNGTANNSENVQENYPGELNKSNSKTCDENDKLKTVESIKSFKNEFKQNFKKINPFKRSNLIAYSLAQSLGESSPECSVANKESCLEDNANNVIQNDEVPVQNIVSVEDEEMGAGNNSENIHQKNPSELIKSNSKTYDVNDKEKTTDESMQCLDALPLSENLTDEFNKEQFNTPKVTQGNYVHSHILDNNESERKIGNTSEEKCESQMEISIDAGDNVGTENNSNDVTSLNATYTLNTGSALEQEGKKENENNSAAKMDLNSFDHFVNVEKSNPIKNKKAVEFLKKYSCKNLESFDTTKKVGKNSKVLQLTTPVSHDKESNSTQFTDKIKISNNLEKNVSNVNVTEAEEDDVNNRTFTIRIDNADVVAEVNVDEINNSLMEHRVSSSNEDVDGKKLNGTKSTQLHSLSSLNSTKKELTVSQENKLTSSYTSDKDSYHDIDDVKESSKLNVSGEGNINQLIETPTVETICREDTQPFEINDKETSLVSVENKIEQITKLSHKLGETTNEVQEIVESKENANNLIKSPHKLVDNINLSENKTNAQNNQEEYINNIADSLSCDEVSLNDDANLIANSENDSSSLDNTSNSPVATTDNGIGIDDVLMAISAVESDHGCSRNMLSKEVIEDIDTSCLLVKDEISNNGIMAAELNENEHNRKSLGSFSCSEGMSFTVGSQIQEMFDSENKSNINTETCLENYDNSFVKSTNIESQRKEDIIGKSVPNNQLEIGSKKVNSLEKAVNVKDITNNSLELNLKKEVGNKDHLSINGNEDNKKSELQRQKDLSVAFKDIAVAIVNINKSDGVNSSLNNSEKYEQLERRTLLDEEISKNKETNPELVEKKSGEIRSSASNIDANEVLASDNVCIINTEPSQKLKKNQDKFGSVFKVNEAHDTKINGSDKCELKKSEIITQETPGSMNEGNFCIANELNTVRASEANIPLKTLLQINTASVSGIENIKKTKFSTLDSSKTDNEKLEKIETLIDKTIADSTGEMDDEETNRNLIPDRIIEKQTKFSPQKPFPHLDPTKEKDMLTEAVSTKCDQQAVIVANQSDQKTEGNNLMSDYSITNISIEKTSERSPSTLSSKNDLDEIGSSKTSNIVEVNKLEPVNTTKPIENINERRRSSRLSTPNKKSSESNEDNLLPKKVLSPSTLSSKKALDEIGSSKTSNIVEVNNLEPVNTTKPNENINARRRSSRLNTPNKKSSESNEDNLLPKKVLSPSTLSSKKALDEIESSKTSITGEVNNLESSSTNKKPLASSIDKNDIPSLSRKSNAKKNSLSRNEKDVFCTPSRVNACPSSKTNVPPSCSDNLERNPLVLCEGFSSQSPLKDHIAIEDNNLTPNEKKIDSNKKSPGVHINMRKSTPTSKKLSSENVGGYLHAGEAVINISRKDVSEINLATSPVKVTTRQSSKTPSKKNNDLGKSPVKINEFARDQVLVKENTIISNVEKLDSVKKSPGVRISKRKSKENSNIEDPSAKRSSGESKEKVRKSEETDTKSKTILSEKQSCYVNNVEVNNEERIPTLSTENGQRGMDNVKKRRKSRASSKLNEKSDNFAELSLSFDVSAIPNNKSTRGIKYKYKSTPLVERSLRRSRRVNNTTISKNKSTSGKSKSSNKEVEMNNSGPEINRSNKKTDPQNDFVFRAPKNAPRKSSISTGQKSRRSVTFRPHSSIISPPIDDRVKQDESLLPSRKMELIIDTPKGSSVKRKRSKAGDVGGLSKKINSTTTPSKSSSESANCFLTPENRISYETSLDVSVIVHATPKHRKTSIFHSTPKRLSIKKSFDNMKSSQLTGNIISLPSSTLYTTSESDAGPSGVSCSVTTVSRTLRRTSSKSSTAQDLVSFDSHTCMATKIGTTTMKQSGIRNSLRKNEETNTKTMIDSSDDLVVHQEPSSCFNRPPDSFSSVCYSEDNSSVHAVETESMLQQSAIIIGTQKSETRSLEGTLQMTLRSSRRLQQSTLYSDTELNDTDSTVQSILPDKSVTLISKFSKKRKQEDSIFKEPGDVKIVRKKVLDPLPKLAKPAKWIKKELYTSLQKKLNEKYPLEKRYLSERLVVLLFNAVNNTLMGHPDLSLPILKAELKKYNICKTQLDYYTFLHSYTPLEFIKKVVPLGRAYGNESFRHEPIKSNDPI